MNRVSKSTVETVFVHFLTAIGKRRAASYDDVGGYRLDANPTYGGYVIEEIQTSGGGVGHPLGSKRRKAADFVDAMRFAMDAIHLENSWLDRIGKKDKRVIDAFTDGKGVEVVGHKLMTDGTRLDGMWMGGSGIAMWVDKPSSRMGRVVEFGPNASRSIQFVQNQVRRALPSAYLEEARAHKKSSEYTGALHGSRRS